MASGRSRPWWKILQWLLPCIALCAAARTGADEAASAAGKWFFWEVSAPGKAPAYVLGSVHAARASLYPLPDMIENAFAHAPLLAVEVDVTDTSRLARVAPLMRYTPPDALDRHLKTATWNEVQAMAKAAAKDPAQFAAIRPAILAEALALGALASRGFDAHLGIDVHFLKEAHDTGKAVEELESLEFQMGVLNGLSDEDADDFLADAIEQIRSGKLFSDTEQIAQAWHAGDTAWLGRILDTESRRDEASRRFMHALFDERNPAMADRIAGIINAGHGGFMVVGAGHLVGPANVLDSLRQRGMTVRQLP